MDRRERIGICLCHYLLLFVSSTVEVTSCPDNVSVELGTDQSITCERDPNFIDFYWYKGPASDNDLVCRLDHGRKSVSAEYREYYDISDSGALILRNASLQHESLYTLAAFDRTGKSEEAHVLINITVTPNPRCLVISSCEPCEACNLSVSRKSGSLVCSVSGSRPSVPLNWKIRSHHGISFIKHQQNEDKDKTTDTWSTSVLLAYEITQPCGVKEVLRCEAGDNVHILESNVALVEISNDVCRDDGVASPTGWKLGVIFAVLFLLILVVVIVSCLVIRRYTSRGRRDGNEVELQTLLRDKNENVNDLLSKLREEYGKNCFLKPLPWGEDIPIASLYTECNYTVTDRKGKTTTSNIISHTTEYIKEERRVVFIGGLGYGKTTMTKWILHHWIEQTYPNFVLFYILLKDVKKEMKVSDIVLESFPQDSRIAIDTIEKVLSSTSCIVLLDGLDELSKYDKERNPILESEQCSSSETDSDNRLTIGELLDGQVQPEYKNVQVWVTSRQIDYVKQQFPLPYITVKLNGFSPDQADEYIKRTCKFYVSCNDDTGNGTSKDKDQFENIEASRIADDGHKGAVPGYNSSFTDRVVKQEVAGPEKEIFDWVKGFVDENDISCDFKDTPLLFVLIVHVLADEFAKSIRGSHPKIPSLTALVSMIITCLESRYVQKKKCEDLPSEIPKLESRYVQKEKCENLQLVVQKLERKLGQIAFDNSVHVGVRERKFWGVEVGEENVDMALEVGLLKLSQNPSSNTTGGRALAFSSFSGIEFYHDFLQEYLAARHILANPNLFSKLKDLVKKRKDDSTIRILQFMSGAVDSQVLEICDILLDMGKWNNFIDCAYEARDRKEFTEIIKKAESKKFNITYLDREYHRCAFKTFCQQCYDLKIKLDKITFRSDFGIEFLTTITLPQCDSLEFYEVTFKESLFIWLLQFLSRSSGITEVRFVKCSVPERISKEFRPGLNDVRERNLKVYRTVWRKELPSVTENLNLQNGKWTWLTFAS